MLTRTKNISIYSFLKKIFVERPLVLVYSYFHVDMFKSLFYCSGHGSPRNKCYRNTLLREIAALQHTRFKRLAALSWHSVCCNESTAQPFITISARFVGPNRLHIPFLCISFINEQTLLRSPVACHVPIFTIETHLLLNRNV